MVFRCHSSKVHQGMYFLQKSNISIGKSKAINFLFVPNEIFIVFKCRNIDGKLMVFRCHSS